MACQKISNWTQIIESDSSSKCLTICVIKSCNFPTMYVDLNSSTQIVNILKDLLTAELLSRPIHSHFISILFHFTLISALQGTKRKNFPCRNWDDWQESHVEAQ